MPLEDVPKTLVPPGPRPGGKEYRVKDGDDWFKVARDNNITAKELMVFNFGTDKPREINWYLKYRVGCKLTTKDKLNWCFSAAADPGKIYLPLKWHRPSSPSPVPIFPEPKMEREPEVKPSGIWFGLGAQEGGHLFVGGLDTVEACLYSLESYDRSFWMNIEGDRIGPGLGASAGMVVVIATGGQKPMAFHNLEVSGVDFQANMGGKWGDVVKGIKGLGMVGKGAKFVDKTISLAKWEKIREWIYNGIKGGSISWNSEKPEVTVMGIPGAGVGLEISLYHGHGKVFVHGQSGK